MVWVPKEGVLGRYLSNILYVARFHTRFALFLAYTDIHSGQEASMVDTEDRGMSPWQHGVIAILRSTRTRDMLMEMVDGLPGSDTPSHILVEAMLNYFSYRNPQFTDNWWEFRGTDITLIVDKKSIRFVPEEDPLAQEMTRRLSSTVPRISWLRTFLYPQPK